MKPGKKEIVLADLLRSKLSRIPRGPIVIVFVLITVTIIILITKTSAINQDLMLTQSAGQDYFTGVVTKIKDASSTDVLGQTYNSQTVEVKLESGRTVEVENQMDTGALASQTVKTGETLVLTKLENESGTQYIIADRYRIPAIIIIFGIFFALTIFFGGFKGLTSILGLFFTIFVLIDFVVPHIVSGGDPLKISLVGASIIAFVSIYMAHGLNRRTTIALLGTVISIAIATFMAVFFVDLAKLNGTGSEEALLLNVSSNITINLRGLLLGGILFGVLGVMDDVTTAQSAAIEEIKRAKPDITFQELYKGGISVGKEHIVSLVNTLMLAYIGSSFPLLLLFSLNQGVPLWVTANSEFIIEEVIRTLVGSSALVIAVPLTTLLAAYAFSKWKVDPVAAGEVHVHSHHH
jgi:uncharacterized membrane protein